LLACIFNTRHKCTYGTLWSGQVNVLLKGISSTNTEVPPDDRDLEIVGSTCAFLHVTFSTLPMERSMTGLAYRTEIVPALWSFIKRCHSSNRWPDFAKFGFSSDSLDWLLPLTVFCPVYKLALSPPPPQPLISLCTSC
jgi:ubiquitin-protein ligase E3 C